MKLKILFMKRNEGINMNFELFLEELKTGKKFEEIVDESFCVECIGNTVYEDESLHAYLLSICAVITAYEELTEIDNCKIGYAVITTDNENYLIPYEEVKNRFDTELPNETILYFGQIMEKKEEKITISNDRYRILLFNTLHLILKEKKKEEVLTELGMTEDEFYTVMNTVN